MLLGFKRRFAPFIESGAKCHTIRPRRARPPRVGETCHCYVDPRQKTMRLLGRWPCVKVEDIEITARAIVIDGVLLDDAAAEAFATRDGFESLEHFFRWWQRWMPFEGNVIHWRWSPTEAQHG